MDARSTFDTTTVTLSAVLVGVPQPSADGAEIRTEISVQSPEEGSVDEAHLPDLGAAILFHLYERKMLDQTMGLLAAHLRAQSIEARPVGDQDGARG